MNGILLRLWNPSNRRRINLSKMRNKNPTSSMNGPPTDDIIAENSPETNQQVNSRIPLAPDESILWHKESSRGLIHKEVMVEEAVTNKRCLKYDVQTRQVVAQIGINHLPQVIIMNIRRINDSLGGGVFLTPRMFGLPGLGGFGVYGGPRRGNLKMFGDVSIMNEGKVVMTFENVKDPQGVRQLIEALKRDSLRFNRRNQLTARWQSSQ